MHRPVSTLLVASALVAALAWYWADILSLLRANAELARARSALDQAKLDLHDTQIRAPLSGYITRRVANPGNQVQAGQALMALRSLEDIWIDANFK